MKKLILCSLFAFGALSESKAISDNEVERIVNAIWTVEGGSKTKFPYGIISIKTSQPRKVCENTVRNNYQRWLKTDRSIPFIKFLGLRYCPPSADPVGHKNWVKNMEVVLK